MTGADTDAPRRPATVTTWTTTPTIWLRWSRISISRTPFTSGTPPVAGKSCGTSPDTVRADSGPLSAKLVQNGTLKTHKRFPHGMPTTEAETLNADLLTLLQS